MRLGPALFQLPPNVQKGRGRVERICASFPQCARVRIPHESWFDDEIFDLIRARNYRALHCRYRQNATPEKITRKLRLSFRLRREATGEEEWKRWFRLRARTEHKLD